MPSVFFKKRFLDKIGYFDDKKFSLTAADSELIQRALLLGKVVYVPEIVSSYRVWQGSLTYEKIASSEWLEEIELWHEKISMLGINNSVNIFDWKYYRGEIFARNLLAGLSNLYTKGEYKQLQHHFSKMKTPRISSYNNKIKTYKRTIVITSKKFFKCSLRIFRLLSYSKYFQHV